MDFQIKEQYFLVGGAGSGFGRAIAAALAAEDAQVLAVSRTEEKLIELQKSFPKQIKYIAGDITTAEVHEMIMKQLVGKKLSGVLVNAGGPPTGQFEEISMEQWEQGWNTVVKWKIQLIKLLLPHFIDNKYGRIVFIESVSVKQPVANLILSNSLRPAIVGFAKTLAQEVAGNGITLNVLAPGYHSTAAMERLFKKKSELENISIDEAKHAFEKEIIVGEMGTPEEMAVLALWLLSPLSRFVTGQTFSHDGGIVKGI
ncbi:MAG TPA: SDR family oxidoreductase, partial [Bacteroidales bacterium]